MIEIFNETKGKLVFETYDALLKHIEIIEKVKFVETGQENWFFTIHSRKTLAEFYWTAIKAIKILLTRKEQAAFEAGFDLLELCKGDQKNTDQIILSSDVDVEKIKEIWCRDYCTENGYTIFERKEVP